MALKKAGRVGRLGLLGLTLVAILVLAAAQAGIHPPTASAQAGGTVEGPTASTPMMSYQGRLVDPTTGNPKPNGAYAMTFKLYDVASAGAALWTESKNVAVNNGLFTTLLGDTTALNLTIFDGRDLWLGVTVSPDLEAIPRIQIAYAPYALFSRNAALAVNADRLGNQLPAAYAPAVHPHNAADITAGTLSTDRYSAFADLTAESYLGNLANNIAQNNGILQPNLNADLLDGQSSAAFATAAHGHFGAAWSGASASYGLYLNNSSTGDGIRSYSAGTAYNFGAIFAINTSSGSGVYASSTSGQGLYGATGGSPTTPVQTAGVYGASAGGSALSFGVYGHTTSTSGRGVWGYASATTGSPYAIGGGTSSPTGYGGYFIGNVNVSGTLSKSAGAFRIDHPLDPQNKYLSHSFVESPDMKNIYDGVATLDPDGTAWVTLPDWFEALNRDFRYQLTAIGAPGPGLYIGSEVAKNRFQIAGGTAGMKVSWQVTGIRKDAYAEANRIAVEEQKPADKVGTYIHPELFGQPANRSENYELMHPAAETEAQPK